MTDSSTWVKRGMIGVAFVILLGVLATIFTSFFPEIEKCGRKTEVSLPPMNCVFMESTFLIICTVIKIYEIQSKLLSCLLFGKKFIHIDNLV